MRHEDGFCDGCGCEVDEAQLTVDGRALCAECAAGAKTPAGMTASKPEARDDGR